MSDEDIDNIIEEVDEDGSGTLDFDGNIIFRFIYSYVSHSCAWLLYFSLALLRMILFITVMSECQCLLCSVSAYLLWLEVQQ